jgi:hypothetical protein
MQLLALRHRILLRIAPVSYFAVSADLLQSAAKGLFVIVQQ